MYLRGCYKRACSQPYNNPRCLKRLSPFKKGEAAVQVRARHMY